LKCDTRAFQTSHHLVPISPQHFFFLSNRSLLRISNNSNSIIPKYVTEYGSDTDLPRQRAVGSSYIPACYFVLIPANCTKQQYPSGLAVVTMVK